MLGSLAGSRRSKCPVVSEIDSKCGSLAAASPMPLEAPVMIESNPDIGVAGISAPMGTSCTTAIRRTNGRVEKDIR